MSCGLAGPGSDVSLITSENESSSLSRETGVGSHLDVYAAPLHTDVLSQIFSYAMQADGNEIVMPRHTGHVVNVGIVLGLLRINHETYHRCRDTLYRDNHFVVDTYGSGLQYLSQSMGVDICRSGCVTRPTIKSLRLVVGSEDHDFQGVLKAEMFTQALRDISHPMTVSRLQVDLSPFCFLDRKDFAQFVEGLSEKIIITKTLELYGSDIHWSLFDLRAVSKAMGMKLEPTSIEFRHHSDEHQTLGWFRCSYKLAGNDNERLGLDADGNELAVRDGKHYWETRQNFLLGVPSDA